MIKFMLSGDIRTLQLDVWFDEGEWVVTDGYETDRYPTELEAKRALEDLADFYDLGIKFIEE